MLFKVKPIPRQSYINGNNLANVCKVLKLIINIFSILLKDSPIQALYSACALGILHQDHQLAETILIELKKYENIEQYVAHIAYLTAQYYRANVGSN